MHSKTKLWISLLIVVVIGLHIVPVLQRLLGSLQTTWPIMAWGMYKFSRPPGPVTTRQKQLVGVTATGERREIRPWQSGLSSFAFERLYLAPMSKGDAETAQRLARQLNAHLDVPIVAFRLESVTYTITDAGVVKQDNPPLIYNLVDGD